MSIYSPCIKIGKLGHRGVTYYICDAEDLCNTIQVALVVCVGANREKHYEYGFSHLTEHMVICSLLYPSMENDLFKDVVIHAYTNFNETVFFIQSAGNSMYSLQKCLLVAKHILDGDYLTNDSMIRAKNEVCNEFNTSSEIKADAVTKLLQPVLGMVHLPLGKIENIYDVCYKDALKFHNKWYAASNSAIIIQSDIAENKVKESLKDVFVSGLSTETPEIPMNNINQYPTINAKPLLTNNVVSSNNSFFISWSKRNSTQGDNMTSYISFLLALDSVKTIIEHCTMNASVTSTVDYSVEIVERNVYLIVFSVSPGSKEAGSFLLPKIKQTELSADDFNKIKLKFLSTISEKHIYNGAQASVALVNECILNFLYDEPIYDIISETRLLIDGASQTHYEFVNNEISAIIENMVQLPL